MIKGLQLDGYRGFSSFRIPELGKVNLLVGRNNCGKSSVLEAVRLLASSGNPVVLSRIARERGEILVFDRDEARARRHSYVDISHFFHGHDIGINSSFELNALEGESLRVTIDELPEEGDHSEQKRLYFSDSDGWSEEDQLPPAFALTVHPNFAASHSRGSVSVPVTRDGAVFADSIHYRRLVSTTLPDKSSVSVGTDSLESYAMRVIWDRILTEGKEEFVVQALQILEPRIKDIVFLSGEGPTRSTGRAGVLVRMQDSKRRLPLGNFGEGMRRVLAIALSLAQSAGTTLLIDEIDTGLHWSVMDKVWELVVKSAVEFDTQVFATTHSLDCLRGLASLCERDTDTAKHVMMHKIQAGLDEAVSFKAAELEVAMIQDIEVR